MLVLVPVHPDAEMPGQQQVGACPVGVLTLQGKDIAPAGGTVFLAGAGVFMIGCEDKGDARIERGAKQQKAQGLGCVIDPGTVAPANR